MNEWGVSAEQIQTDAMAADQNRGVVLMDMNEMVKSMIFGGNRKIFCMKNWILKQSKIQCSV